MVKDRVSVRVTNRFRVSFGDKVRVRLRLGLKTGLGRGLRTVLWFVLSLQSG